MSIIRICIAHYKKDLILSYKVLLFFDCAKDCHPQNRDRGHKSFIILLKYPTISKLFYEKTGLIYDQHYDYIIRLYCIVSIVTKIYFTLF